MNTILSALEMGPRAAIRDEQAKRKLARGMRSQSALKAYRLNKKIKEPRPQEFKGN